MGKRIISLTEWKGGTIQKFPIWTKIELKKKKNRKHVPQEWHLAGYVATQKCAGIVGGNFTFFSSITAVTPNRRTAATLYTPVTQKHGLKNINNHNNNNLQKYPLSTKKHHRFDDYSTI